MSQKNDAKDPFNSAGMYTFIVTMAVTFGFFFYISFIHEGVYFDKIREADAPAVKLASFDPGTVDNPWVTSKEMVDYGAKKYKTYCASCHGDKGMGDGPAAGGLVPRPRNLVEGDWKHGGDTLGMYKLVYNGASGTSMAGYGSTFSKAEIWALIHFVQSITKNNQPTDMAQLEAFAKSQ